MRITVKVDSATSEEVRALQLALHSASRGGEGMNPHQHIPGADTHSPTSVYAWVAGPNHWSASTPAMPGSYGVDLLRQLVSRIEPPPTRGNVDALDTIADLLDGKEWSVETIERVAAIVRQTGRRIGEPV